MLAAMSGGLGYLAADCMVSDRCELEMWQP